MFIQTETTPNPASVKFLPGCEVLARGVAEFKTAAEAAASPLAQRLFALSGVATVFLGPDFVTVTKTDEAAWDVLKTPALAAIMDHFLSGQPVMMGEAAAEDVGADSEVVRQIREILDTRVRPAVARDGGDIAFVSFDGGIVYVQMRGACAGCPSSTATLKSGVENLLRHFVPEVEEVRAVSF